jgi:hypothetical protein
MSPPFRGEASRCPLVLLPLVHARVGSRSYVSYLSHNANAPTVPDKNGNRKSVQTTEGDRRTHRASTARDLRTPSLGSYLV